MLRRAETYGVILIFLSNLLNISLSMKTDVLETSIQSHFFKAVVCACIISVITYFYLIVLLWGVDVN